MPLSPSLLCNSCLHLSRATPLSPSPSAMTTTTPTRDMGKIIELWRRQRRSQRRRSYGPLVLRRGPFPCSEKLLHGMNVTRFNFSHGSHEYHQETLDNLRAAMESTGIL